MTKTQAVFTANGTPATKGICPECGTKLFRMGRTDDHEGLTPPPKKKRNNRKGKLVIVESPAKARTVGRFLGKGYTVKASKGHVRDLLKSQISVDVENEFQPKYRVPKEKRDVVKEIKSLSKKSAEIYLATDPDREGEAIAWHLMESADIDPEITRRVVFHEITAPAVEEAFAHPREINQDLVNAQQARRILDRLVGYNLSPLLWRKVRGRLSAGRVQSVALRLVVEREREIDSFVPEEYWSISAEFQPKDIQDTFIAKLARVNGQEPELKSEEDVKPIVENMERSNYSITQIKRGERKRKPSAPYTTSTLQQEASRRLGFTARRTMSLAQQLYEGIEIDDGDVGLITYMRTDSTHVAETAKDEARKYILKRHGGDFLPKKPRVYKTKIRGAQEAHEAIRPTSVLRRPKSVKSFLTRDQYRLYQLIWMRFVASQMASAVYDTLQVEITGTGTAQEMLLRASGSSIKFPGFLVVYEETLGTDQQNNGENGNTNIPEGIEEGQDQRLVQVLPEQHFTQPPPRYSEASLVRTLEENGIGRPSTYAPIIGTLQQRGYVVREERRLFPTETGYIVNDLILEHFPNIVDLEFTAQMEDDLDQIASGKTEWTEPIQAFYGPFAKQVKQAEKAIPEMKVEPESIGRSCPKCGHDLVIRWGRYGKFISCSNFPACRHTEPWLEKIGVACPNDGGEVVERRTRKGRVFYGCANYPECDFTSWKRPLPTPCPSCQGMLVIAKKDQAQCLKCEEVFPLDSVATEKVS
jgi:DNA topoisomerase-1